MPFAYTLKHPRTMPDCSCSFSFSLTYSSTYTSRMFSRERFLLPSFFSLALSLPYFQDEMAGRWRPGEKWVKINPTSFTVQTIRIPSEFDGPDPVLSFCCLVRATLLHAFGTRRTSSLPYFVAVIDTGAYNVCPCFQYSLMCSKW